MTADTSLLQNVLDDDARLTSRVRRLEQQSPREHVRGVSSSLVVATPAALDVPVDIRLDQATDAAHLWVKTLERCEQLSKDVCDWDALRRFIQQQAQLADSLGRDNAKLRDQLQTAGATRRKLLVVVLARLATT